MKSFLYNLQCCFSKPNDVIVNDEDDEEEEKITLKKKEEIEKKLENKLLTLQSTNVLGSKATINHNLNNLAIINSLTLTSFKGLLSQNQELSSRYNKILVDDKYIRQEERNLITFVKNFL